jgi:hypothetical protein
MSSFGRHMGAIIAVELSQVSYSCPSHLDLSKREELEVIKR